MFPEGLLGRQKSWWGHYAALSYDPNMRVPEIRQPTLVLNPADDLQQETRRGAALIPHGRMVELPAWGHGFLEGFTEDALKLITSFLDGPDSDPFAALIVPESATEPTPASRSVLDRE